MIDWRLLYTPSGGGIDLKMAVFVVVFLCTLLLLLLQGIQQYNVCVCHVRLMPSVRASV